MFSNNAAAKQMRECIVQLVLDAFGDQFYSKALQCVNVLREEAIKVKKALKKFNILHFTKKKVLHVHQFCMCSAQWKCFQIS